MTVTISTSLDNNTDKEKRRQIRPGLEINTDTAKNNAFFSMSSTSTPRPPPSISRKLSVKKSTSTPVDIPPKTPTSSIPPVTPIIEGDDLFHYDSYANRLRNLVSRLHEPSMTTSTTVTPFEAAEELQCLPTPIPSESHHSSPPHNHFFPTDPSPPQIDLIGQEIGQYRILKLLGVGAFSKVYLGHHNQQYYAMKVIPKSIVKDTRVRSSIEREISILKDIDHPNIVHLETILETDEMMCIVLEYVEGGELFEIVKRIHDDNEAVDEQRVKHLFLQLLNTVQWLHDHNIVHRDLKLENILLQRDQDTIKITDFGLARIIDPENPLLVTRCGSEEYAAPEIVQQQNYDGRKTDIWALGIILFSLLVGYLPFRYDPRKHERVSQLFYRIVRADIKWPKDKFISEDAKFVVKSILETHPEKRMSIQEIQQLPWFQS